MKEGRAPRFERLAPGRLNVLPPLARAPAERLAEEIRAVSHSPVVSAVLEVADAILLVLNRERQIVAFNSRVAEVRRPEEVLGLRPGEALGCVNARCAGGCGASPACRTCGALGAILGAQQRSRPVESECLIQTGDGPARHLEFNVRATPVVVDETPFTVVSLRDISSEKRRETLEQVFFHDVLNTVAGLRGWAQRLRRAPDEVARASDRIDYLSGHIEREIRDHRALLLAEDGALVPEPVALRSRALLDDVAAVFAGDPVARERRVEIGASAEDVDLVADRALLSRVLINMVRNALEASPPGGVVHLSSERAPSAVRILVRNDGVIAPEIRPRVFQRSFSTKAERGRGLGTYSMKLFGERYLGGSVSFDSSAEAGTVFSITLPVDA